MRTAHCVPSGLIWRVLNMYSVRPCTNLSLCIHWADMMSPPHVSSETMYIPITFTEWALMRTAHYVPSGLIWESSSCIWWGHVHIYITVSPVSSYEDSSLCNQWCHMQINHCIPTGSYESSLFTVYLVRSFTILSLCTQWAHIWRVPTMYLVRLCTHIYHFYPVTLMRTAHCVPSGLTWRVLMRLRPSTYLSLCTQWAHMMSPHHVSSEAICKSITVPSEVIWGLLTMYPVRLYASLLLCTQRGHMRTPHHVSSEALCKSIIVYPVRSYEDSSPCIQWGLMLTYYCVPREAIWLLLTMYPVRPYANISLCTQLGHMRTPHHVSSEALC